MSYENRPNHILKRRLIGGALGVVMVTAAGLGTAEYVAHRRTPACRLSYTFDGGIPAGDSMFTTPDGRPGRVHVFDSPDYSIRVGVAPASQRNMWGVRDYHDLADASFERPKAGASEKLSFVLGGNWSLEATVTHDEITTMCVPNPPAEAVTRQ